MFRCYGLDLFFFITRKKLFKCCDFKKIEQIPILCMLKKINSMCLCIVQPHLIFTIWLIRSILDRQRIPNTTQMKVTKMLLVISTVFVILNLPSYVIRVWIFIVSVSKCTMYTLFVDFFSCIQKPFMILSTVCVCMSIHFPKLTFAAG